MKSNNGSVVLMFYILIICQLQIGCKKSCYNCKVLYASIRCVKAADTIYFLTYNYTDLQDSLNYYTGNGYSCDTGSFYWTSAFVGNPICKDDLYRIALAAGDSCNPE